MPKENNELTDVRLEILLTPTDKRRLQVLSQRWRMSMGSTIRLLIQREMERG